MNTQYYSHLCACGCGEQIEIIEPHTTGEEMLMDAFCHVIVAKKMKIVEKI